MANLAGGKFLAQGGNGRVFVPPFGKLPEGADPLRFVGKVQPMSLCDEEYESALTFSLVSPEFGVYPIRRPTPLRFDRTFDDSDDPEKKSWLNEFERPKELLGELVYPLATATFSDTRLRANDVTSFLCHLKCMIQFVLCAAQLSDAGIVHNDLHTGNIVVLGSSHTLLPLHSSAFCSVYAVNHPTAYKAIDLGASTFDAAVANEAKFAACLARGIWQKFGLQDATYDSANALHDLSDRHGIDCSSYAKLAVVLQSLLEDAQHSFPVEAAAAAAAAAAACSSSVPFSKPNPRPKPKKSPTLKRKSPKSKSKQKQTSSNPKRKAPATSSKLKKLRSRK
jgi:hypothetical protein